MDLTEKGFDQIDEIITIIFQYLNLLKKEGVHKWIFDECCDLNEIKFNFKEKISPFFYVSWVAKSMQDYPIEEAIKNAYVLDDFRPDLIDELIGHLKPENLLVYIVAREFSGKTDRKEKYFEFNYSCEQINEDRINRWKNAGLNSKLSLPYPNEFIPKNLELVEREEINNHPILLRTDNYSHVWYLQDNDYKVPKAFYFIHIKSPVAFLDPISLTAIKIYAKLLSDKLNEYAYAASLAGINFSIETTIFGLVVRVSGYNEKLTILLSKIVDQMMKFDFDRARFDVIKESHYRKLKNFSGQAIHVLLDYYYRFLASDKAFSHENYLETIDQVTYERVESIVKSFYSSLFFEIFVHGNVTKKDVDDVENLTKNALIKNYNSFNALEASLLPKRHLKLDDSFYIFEKQSDFHQSNAILSYYQFKLNNSNLNVRFDLIQNIFSEPCFHKLRTEEQLGYVVFMRKKK